MKLQNIFSFITVLGVCMLMLLGSSFLVVKSVSDAYSIASSHNTGELNSSQNVSRQTTNAASQYN